MKYKEYKLIKNQLRLNVDLLLRQLENSNLMNIKKNNKLNEDNPYLIRDNEACSVAIEALQAFNKNAPEDFKKRHKNENNFEFEPIEVKHDDRVCGNTYSECRKIFRFDNDYGAIVVNCYGNIGTEMSLIKFHGEGNWDWDADDGVIHEIGEYLFGLQNMTDKEINNSLGIIKDLPAVVNA